MTPPEDTPADAPHDCPPDPATSTTPDARERLLALGLPVVLDPADRRRALVRRCAPILTLAAVALTGWQLVLVGSEILVDAQLTASSGNDDIVLDASDPGAGQFLLGLALIMLAPFAAGLHAGIARRLSSRTNRALATASASSLLVLPALPVLADLPSLLETVALSGAVLASILWAGYIGLGSVLAWASRRVVTELWSLGPMIARVLPVLMIAVLFLFFNAEIWQIAAAMTMTRTWLSMAVIAALTVTLVIMTTRDEMTDLDEGEDIPLRLSERINVVLIPVAVRLIQVVLFSLLVFGFFLAFGQLSIPGPTIEQWLERPPTPFSGILSVLPVSQTLTQVSMVLGAFSGLNFAATIGADPVHRRAFLDPIRDEVADGLRTRAAYLSRHSHPGRARAGVRAHRGSGRAQR